MPGPARRTGPASTEGTPEPPSITPRYDWSNPSFLRQGPERDEAYRRVREAIASGNAPEPDALLFTASGGGGAECYDAALDLVRHLGELGVTMDEGHYRGSGADSAHAWARMLDGTVLDVTHAQFGGAPVVVARPGTAMYDNYISTALETASERAQRDLDPVTAEERASFHFPLPAGRT